MKKIDKEKLQNTITHVINSQCASFGEKDIIAQVKCELSEKDYKEKELIDLVKRTLSILESYGVIVRIKNDAFRFRV